MVTYALPIWGCCTNKSEFNSLESIHCRGARVIYSLPRNMPSEDVREIAYWDSLFDTYKVKRATLIYNMYNCITPSCLDYAKRAKQSHALRNLNFNEESPEMGRPQVDSYFAFY